MSAKILLLDIETFPNLYYSWRLWEGHTLDTLEFSSICSYSVKWLYGKQTTKCIHDFNNNEKEFIGSLWKFIDEADLIVAHHGKAFDFGRINSAFIKHGFPPPSPTQKVDTKRAAKETFGFDSNSLDGLCQFLKLGKKMETGGYDLWRDCMAGDTSAWSRMKKYNAHDVILLEKLYLKLRPWMANHPNLNLYSKGDLCPKCGGPGDKIQSRGIHRAVTRLYQRYQCQTCKGWLKEVKSIPGTKSKYISTNV